MKRILRNPVLGLAAALLGALLLPLVSGGLDPYFMDVAVGVGINLILAVSLNLVNGHAGQFSLGHAGFMAVGAYAASWMTLHAPASLLGESAALPVQELYFLGALLLGGLCASLAGALVAAPSIRLQGDYLALLTLGFGEIVRVLLQNCEPLGGALGLIGMPALTNLSWTFGAAAVTIYTVHVMTRSTLGLGFHAVRGDEIAARSVGLDTTRLKLVAFVVGAFFAGVAGALFAHFKLAIDPRGFDFTRSVEIVIMVILGGMGSTRGVACAAVLLTLLPEVLRPVAEYRMVLYALILVLLMLLRPQGLLGERKPLAPPPRA
jgi:branched-chain amino acid transport system permease protein